MRGSSYESGEELVNKRSVKGVEVKHAVANCLAIFLLLLMAIRFTPHPPHAYAEENNPTYFRGENYETLSYPNNTVIWTSASQYVSNGTDWVPYIFTNKYSAEGCYEVKSGLIGAKFYKGKVEYYDPTLTHLAVARENWVVFKRVDGEWKPVCASLASYFNSKIIVETDEYVDISGTWLTSAGNLTVTYHFEGNLKHTVVFTPNSAGRFAVAQIWNGTVYDKVKLNNATVIRKHDDVKIGKADALTVLFHDKSQPFGIREDQTSAGDKFQYVIFAGGTVTYEGIRISDAVAWIFGAWNLDSGESLTIDPATETWDAPSYGDVWYVGDNYSTAHDASTGTGEEHTDEGSRTIGQYYSDPNYGIFRCLAYWDTSGIPDGAVIDAAKVRLHGYTGTDLTGANFTIKVQKWTEATSMSVTDYDGFDGTNYDAGTFNTSSWVTGSYNNVTLSNFDVINKTSDTTVILRSSRDVDSTTPTGMEYVETSWAQSANPPKLEVTYHSNPTIGQFQASSTVYANQYFFLNCTIDDGDGVADFVNATVELSNSIILKWDNSTNTFSEEQDTNEYCTLDASNSIRTTVNDTAYKLSWKIQLSWSYPEGSVSVIVTNTKVYDSSGASASSSQSNLFTFEDDLIVSVASVSPTTAEPTQTVTFSGTLYYEGTSTAPENTTDITAKVSLNADVKGTTTTIETDGSFSIGVVAPEDEGSFSYLVYALTDAGTVTNQTVQLTVEGGTSSPSSPGALNGGVTIPAEPILPPQNVTLPPPYTPPAPTPTTPVELPIGIIIIVGTIVLAFGYKQFKRESRLIWPTQKRKSPTWNQKKGKDVSWKRKRRKNPEWKRRKPLE